MISAPAVRFHPSAALLAAFLFLAAPLIHADPPATAPPATAPAVVDPNAPLPSWDVVSIRPNKSDNNMIRMMSTPDGISQSNIRVKSLIATAYGVKDDLVSGGPGWIDSAPYDIEAKVAGPDVPTYKALSRDQRNVMLQALLTDRFKLAVHTETKEMPIYELVLAKGGPKLKEAKAGDTYPNGIKDPDGPARIGFSLGAGAAPGGGGGRPGMMRMDGRGKFTGQGLPLGTLVDILSRQLHRTIVDKTGLTGKYDFTLEYTPDDAPRGDMAAAHGDGAPDPNGPTVFTALEEQLGLHLNSTKGPVKTVVIDHIDPPTEN
jgi:uncharacterized protein (TIGR03435 family)